jgi:hypothetical protein
MQERRRRRAPIVALPFRPTLDGLRLGMPPPDERSHGRMSAPGGTRYAIADSRQPPLIELERRRHLVFEHRQLTHRHEPEIA